MLTYTRDEAIKALIERDMDDQFFYKEILMDGFKGYYNYSNAELEETFTSIYADEEKVTVID